jgi:hypothetical protein
MPLRPTLRLILVLTCATLSAHAAKPCIPIDQAQQNLNKDICISAHVYDVVELPDGTRFLDVCTPQTPDDACRFTIISLQEDRPEVGELKNYRDMNIQVRGIVQSIHGRAGLVLSHARQFNGGPPKFRPNPLLARGFNAAQSRPPVNAPSLHTQGTTRSFMSNRDQESRPLK